MWTIVHSGHPERPDAEKCTWILKQVQDDECGWRFPPWRHPELVLALHVSKKFFPIRYPEFISGSTYIKSPQFLEI